jgi:ABC-2 type transport system ATP-binding protein
LIEIEHLTKRYGDHLAVSDLSVEIESGQIYGFLGPNGAGKSTTMNIMTGCLSATEGHVRIDGYDIFEQPEKAKRLIGYLPEQPPLYLNETPLEYLRFVGEAKGVRGEDLKRQIQDTIERTGIEKVCRRRISALSKGYKQRVGIAQALLGSPEVIILDEPTVGLDPIQIIEIRNLVKDLGKTHTVIFSSHILSEVQAICDKILIISNGKLTALGTPAELERQLRSAGEIVLTTEASAEKAAELLSTVPHITEISRPETAADGAVTLRLKTDSEDIYAVSRSVFFAFAKAEQALLELSIRKASLEDVFLKLTEDSRSEEADALSENPEEREAEEE